MQKFIILSIVRKDKRNLLNVNYDLFNDGGFMFIGNCNPMATQIS